jgi:hypothetical protein
MPYPGPPYQPLPPWRPVVDIPLQFVSRAYYYNNLFQEKVLAKSEILVRAADPSITVNVSVDKYQFEDVDAVEDKEYSSENYSIHNKPPHVLTNADNRENEPYRLNYAPVKLTTKPPSYPSYPPPFGPDEYIYLFEEMYIDVLQKHKVDLDTRLHGLAFIFKVENSKGTLYIDSIITTCRIKTLARERGE